MKWNKYSEKQPNKRGRYLVVQEYKNIKKINILNFAVCLHDEDQVFDDNFNEGWYESNAEIGPYEWKNITYWTKLPTLPEESEEEYINAVIRLKVPEWQIGQEVNVHFPDTMCKKGICEYE